MFQEPEKFVTPKCPPEFYPIVRLSRRLILGIWVGALLAVVLTFMNKFFDPMAAYFFHSGGLFAEDAANAAEDFEYRWREYAGIVAVAFLLLGLFVHMMHVTWTHCCLQNLQKWGLTSDKHFASLVNVTVAIPVLSQLASVLYLPPLDFLTRKRSVILSGNPKAVRSVVVRSLIFPLMLLVFAGTNSLLLREKHYIATGTHPAGAELFASIVVSLSYVVGMIFLIAWAWSSLVRHITQLQLERYIELLQESTNACPKCGEFVHPSFPRCLVCGHPLTVPD
ncbi:MAG: hypothetical protein CMJ46_12430 [Planctomyces sp.]|nr:hypothetical protein [Planctomyces sp.]